MNIQPFANNYEEINFEIFVQADVSQTKISIISASSEFMNHVIYTIEVKSPYFHTFYANRRYNEFKSLYKAVNINIG